MTTHSTPPTSTDTPTPPEDPRPPRTIRPLLTRLHFYAAIFIAPFILVAAVSGALYALTPQLENVVHGDEVHTDSRGAELSIDDQVAAAREAQPDLPLLAVRPAPEEGMTTRVMFDDGRTDDSRSLAVFVDPVEGEVTGELTSYGGSGALPVRTWIDELHRGLHLGDTGRLYSELAASWLWVIALAGLVLWWTAPKRRDERGSRLAARLRPGGRKGRRRLLSWHGALGTWIVLGMLMLSATGLTWSQHAGANVTELRTALDWTTPTISSDLESGAEGGGDHSGHTGHGGDTAEAPVEDAPGVGYQAALDSAMTQDLQGPVEIAGPASATGTYTVTELDASWPTQADAVAVDPADGSVVDVVRFDDYPLAAKMATWGIDLHMGLLFGIWSQVALVLLAGGIAVMIVLGYRMWWQRRPTRDHRRVPGRAPRRGAWREAHPAALVALGVAALVVGWFVPLLGLSLLAFLLVDVVLGLREGRAAGPSDPGPESGGTADATPMESMTGGPTGS